MSSNLQNLYRQVIMDHYKNPRNKGLIADAGYQDVHLKNPTCGDDVTISVKASGDVIDDIRHEGVGCAICCSSASVMSEVLVDKTFAEALHITDSFYEIVKGEDIADDLDEDDMGDAIVYAGVSQFPARIKCATIAWKAFEEAVAEVRKARD
ncbi:MAG: SUF system NifU family Fe-S cluster assembly protein [Turicibacter sp.]|nr:SUF system NifU family Fe-S cluster assembly protein [Turicibacter sp.]